MLTRKKLSFFFSIDLLFWERFRWFSIHEICIGCILFVHVWKIPISLNDVLFNKIKYQLMNSIVLENAKREYGQIISATNQ